MVKAYFVCIKRSNFKQTLIICEFGHLPLALEMQISLKIITSDNFYFNLRLWFGKFNMVSNSTL